MAVGRMVSSVLCFHGPLSWRGRTGSLSRIGVGHVGTFTLMHGSKLSLGTWADFLFTTNLNRMKLHRDLGVTQKTAWHLAHRIRTVSLKVRWR